MQKMRKVINILRGMASVLEIIPSSRPPVYRLVSLPRSKWAGIRADGEKIGRDFRSVLSRGLSGMSHGR